MSERKLSAAQAMAWATAEVTALQIKATLDAAKKRCDELRARYESRLQPSTDPDDVDKDVKVATAGGWSIRRTRFTGGERFSLTGYVKAGHDITPEMSAHISAGSPQVRVTVKRVAGPTKPGAVERTS
jgi:hypothetical protein